MVVFYLLYFLIRLLDEFKRDSQKILLNDIFIRNWHKKV